METETSGMSATDRLLIEGSLSYPYALVAIDAFQSEVYSRCKVIAKAHKNILENTLGAKIRDADFSKYPKKETSEEAAYNPELACTIQTPVMRKTRSRFYLGIMWLTEGKYRDHVAVFTGLETGEPARSLLKAMFPKFSEFEDYFNEMCDTGVYLAQALKIAEINQFGDVLSKQCEAWAHIGERCGSLLTSVQLPDGESRATDGNGDQNLS